MPACSPHHPPSQEHGAALCVHFIGAHPARQGQGLGGAMLRHICSLADERRLHAYLEASTHRSKVGWSAVWIRCGGWIECMTVLQQACTLLLATCSSHACIAAAQPANTTIVQSLNITRLPTVQELYARHGFVHVADKPLGDEEGAPVLKVMIRSPSSAVLSAPAEPQGAEQAAAAAAAEQADGVDTD